MTKGEVGVWNGPKKVDVIYEQPLMKSMIIVPTFTNENAKVSDKTTIQKSNY